MKLSKKTTEGNSVKDPKTPTIYMSVNEIYKQSDIAIISMITDKK